MRIVLANIQDRLFTLTGICPHARCNRPSTFLLSTNVYVDKNDLDNPRWVAAMQCQGCAKYILAVVRHSKGYETVACEEYYPLGTCDDSVAEEIPLHIQPDFKEALRCQFARAYNATAEMCRRALEASCLDLGAPKDKVLDDMIDWLEEKRKITPQQQKMAHKIRLGGNRGAHPEGAPAVTEPTATEPATTEPDAKVPITAITEEHAKAIVKFTQEFFHHIYVVPKQLDKYDFSKPKGSKA